MRKVFLVDVVEPLAARQKRHTCTSYYVLSSSEAAAESTVRERFDLTDDYFVRVGEFDDDGIRDFVFRRRATWWSAETLAKAKQLLLPPVQTRRSLGRAQKLVLAKLAEHPLPDSRWAYQSVVQTIRILETLTKYALVQVVDGTYRLTDKGQATLRTLKSSDPA